MGRQDDDTRERRMASASADQWQFDPERLAEALRSSARSDPEAAALELLGDYQNGYWFRRFAFKGWSPNAEAIQVDANGEPLAIDWRYLADILQGSGDLYGLYGVDEQWEVLVVAVAVLTDLPVSLDAVFHHAQPETRLLLTRAITKASHAQGEAADDDRDRCSFRWFGRRIGPKAETRLPRDVLNRVDQYAALTGQNRAEALRTLITTALDDLDPA
ncbi:hypothetical protein GTW37_24675 [Streptomyces sp. SID4931]|nr:hypothetical protein [Streptomyces sp. SID4931]SCG00905.1 hypothetical protein GA0115255_115932 [Streptomyces sp. Ncost-T6T-2b]